MIDTLKKTRNDSYSEICKSLTSCQVSVIRALLQREKLSAQEVANWLYKNNLIASSERNYADPRLTELRDLGLVEVVGKTFCATMHRNVGVWKIKDEALLYVKECIS